MNVVCFIISIDRQIELTRYSCRSLSRARGVLFRSLASQRVNIFAGLCAGLWLRPCVPRFLVHRRARQVVVHLCAFATRSSVDEEGAVCEPRGENIENKKDEASVSDGGVSTEARE